MRNDKPVIGINTDPVGFDFNFVFYNFFYFKNTNKNNIICITKFLKPIFKIVFCLYYNAKIKLENCKLKFITLCHKFSKKRKNFTKN